MRILFVLHKPSFARYFEPLLDELGRRGDEVHVVMRPPRRRRRAGAEREIIRRGDDLVDRLCERHEGITRGPAVLRTDRWTALAIALRRGIDYLRYLEPVYANAPKLRARARRKTSPFIVRISGWPVVRSRAGRRVLDRVMRALDRLIPDSAEVAALLREHSPDLVLLTPLVNEPWQLDYVRAARALGIRSALAVASWDNLTNKGLVQDAPDRILMWNDEQRREAVELHGVDPARLVTTGAQCFDQWFERRPSTSAEGFRRGVGLPAEGPIVLYVCSYEFIAPDEPAFVERWLDALRSHPDGRLRSAGILVRPHPKSGGAWRDRPLGERPGVVVWPAAGALPTDEESKSGYFDSLFHSSVVVGINTSALIESAIVGRPVFTVLDPQFADTQEGTLHFHYLLRTNGGPLTVAGALSEHFDQLADALGREGADEQVRAFVHSFVRPYGLERPALPVLVQAIDAQVREPAPAPATPRVRHALGGVVLRPLAAAAARG